MLKKISLSANQPISDAISCIEASGGEIALVLDEAGRLAGTITDGDIRRGLLKGATLTSSASEVMNRRPHSAIVGTPRFEIARRLREKLISQMPIVNADGVVVDLLLADGPIRPSVSPHQVILMAGGLGSRLWPMTERVPKPMIEVGGRPILETIIERFAQQGFRSISICVNHLANIIEDYFEDGTRFGVDITYVRENKRMGTAGALSLLNPIPHRPVIVMNGDILTAVNFNQMLAYHDETNALITVGLNQYQYQIPYGVVNVHGNHISSFIEKPIYDFFVSAGIYIISPDSLSHIPPNAYLDMPSLFELIDKDRCIAFPIHEYWLDIGRQDDLERATREYETHFPNKAV